MILNLSLKISIFLDLPILSRSEAKAVRERVNKVRKDKNFIVYSIRFMASVHSMPDAIHRAGSVPTF